jgi:hypothetical protein
MSFLTDFGPDSLAVQLWARAKARRHGFQLQCDRSIWALTKDDRMIMVSSSQFMRISELAAAFDGLFQTIVPIRSGGMQVLDFSRLRPHTHQASGLTFELLQWPEPDEHFELYLEEYRASPKDLVFDLGAECGLSTHQLAKLVGQVVAFEPDLASRATLSRNIERSKLQNVTVAAKSASSLEDLTKGAGVPVFCRINLERVSPDFVLQSGDILLASNILFAGRGRYTGVRSHFLKDLREYGYESAADNSLGFFWSWPVVG